MGFVFTELKGLLILFLLNKINVCVYRSSRHHIECYETSPSLVSFSIRVC